MLEDKDFKKMAALLREGATMLNNACPECNSPLFKKKSKDIFCPICEKKVIILKEGEEIPEVVKKSTVLNGNLEENIREGDGVDSDLLKKLEAVLRKKLKLIIKKLEQEDQLENLRIYSIILLNFLKLMEKLKFRNP